MSWHYKFYAETKSEIKDGMNAHLGTINQQFVCSLTTRMLEAVNTLADDQEGIGWIVECFGHVGTTRESACNFSFKVEPINTTKNQFYRRDSGDSTEGKV